MEMLARLANLPGALPGACAQGLIWGIMAIGVYLTYRILDVADLTVDGSFGTGGAVCVMCLLPNAGSFGMTVSAAMVFGLISLMFLDTSINMAMQPFKMMVGDMVNEKQKGLAYSIQSFLCNAGSLAGYLFPFIFAAIGISNIAPKG